MVEFINDYHTPMDRQYHGIMSDVPPSASIEQPMFTIGELGQTVPERDPAGRFQNIIQNVQAGIRGGAGVIQLVLNVHPESAIGGRPKAYGKEVREALREVIMANDVLFAGVELPTQISNLSGFDAEQNVISERKRSRDLDEVRDAIKFTADVGQGGGVDVFTADVPRNFFEAPWNQEGKWAGAFQVPEEEKQGIIRYVDERTGQIRGMRLGEGIYRPFDPKKIDPQTGGPALIEPDEKGEIDLKKWSWSDFKEWAKKEGKSPFEYFKEASLKREAEIAEADAFFHYRRYTDAKSRAETETDEALRSRWERESQAAYNGFLARKEEAREKKESVKHLKLLEEYGPQKAMEGFAQAGIYAMEETHNNPRIKRPVYVGPELGWPQGYGGHPDEFIELIKGARKIMAEKLEKERAYTREEAEEQAGIHIKGLFDSSHMGMWLQHFRPELPWHQRVNEFNKWYLEQVKKLAEENKKEDLIGGIQLVNSASAAHGHLPPGQGIFPVIDAAKIFKKEGFSGFIVSEGHEEENVGAGRIMMETWRSMGAPYQTTYGPGAQQRTFGYDPGYISRQRAPVQMFGTYAPPFGEYRPWNEIPFE